ncbi:MAG: hypothetical protein BMS9Abin25_0460 [Gammaproteobacteria bacterium]|nr:MAG: hypothetical protein BMS9Abin25_0460 [Gammaproteobacteria bacterium]
MFIQRVINVLEDFGVSYAVVGGYAVALHGAVRGTVDIDLVIALTRQSFENTEKAMLQLDLQPLLPVSSKDVFNFREEYIRNRNLIAWSFSNPQNPLEVVDILITEDARLIEVVELNAFDMKVRIASIPDLIRMKREAKRPQDIEDIRALEKLS